MPYALFIAGSLLVVALSWLKPRYTVVCGAVVLAAAILFAGLRGNSNDYGEYVARFQEMAASTLPLLPRLYIGKDPWFGGLMLTIQSLGLDVQSLFLASSALALSLKAKSFARVFGSYATPLFVTICATYFLHEYTQIRVGIALGFSFVGLVALCEDRIIPWILCSVLAVGFHISAIAIVLCELPFVFKLESALSLLLYGAAGLMGVLMTSGILSAASNVVSRVSTYESDAAVTSHAIFAIAFKAVIISALAFLVIRDEKEPARLRLWKICYFMEMIGVGIFLIFLNRAPGLGFRIDELLDAFAVFIVSASLLWRGRLSWGLAFGYCMALILILASSNLLLPYRLSDRPLW